MPTAAWGLLSARSRREHWRPTEQGACLPTAAEDCRKLVTLAPSSARRRDSDVDLTNAPRRPPTRHIIRDDGRVVDRDSARAVDRGEPRDRRVEAGDRLGDDLRDRL